MVQLHLLPSPRAYPRGIASFFLTGRYIPHPRARRKRQFPTHGTRHWSHTALTHTRETKRLFAYKVMITIFISVQNHTINIPETHAVDITHAFPALQGAYRYSYWFRTLLLQVQFVPQARTCTIHFVLPNKSNLIYRPNVSILTMNVRTQNTCFAGTIFNLPHPPTPGTRPLRTIPHPRARRAGLVPWVARGDDYKWN